MIALGQPWTLFGIDVEGRLSGRDGFVGCLDLDGGRENFVVERHHGFDQPRCSRGRFGMPDHRLDRTQGTPRSLTAGIPVNAGEAACLRGVSDDGARAVGLQEPDRIRRHARISICGA